MMGNSISNLKHTAIPITGGGKVLVLNTGAIISPESEAMLQALHSRSVGGIQEHLKTLSEKGSDKFMSTFYVGYGHKSIGDCGTCTVFIEGVSMLVAKAIQDWPLYSGQEASTRYIDFSTQKFIDPFCSKESKEILERWRSFYCNSITSLQSDLTKRFPKRDGEKEVVYKKAINARAFDIMRGFLPAGATTNLSWHSNLRQLSDKLALLKHHPLSEVRDVAFAIKRSLIETFPSSFNNKHYSETEEYNKMWMSGSYYYESKKLVDFKMSRDDIDYDMVKLYPKLFSERPMKTELPKFLDQFGQIQFKFSLDFGSVRDLHRHRAVNQRMPLVTTKHGFGNWYLKELPSGLRRKAKKLLVLQEKSIKSLGVSPEISQYYTAMGYNLPNCVTGGLPALVYLIELRATRFVHPTLRKRAIQMGNVLENMFGNSGLKIHFDKEPDRFDVKRGEHDITIKSS